MRETFRACDARVARIDLGNIACLPSQMRRGGRREDEVITGVACAAGIDQRPLDQLPGLVLRCHPIGQIRCAGQNAQLMLPVSQRAFIAVIDFDHIEQRHRALTSQPAIEPMTERTEVAVLAIAQCEHAVAQVLERRVCAQHALHETSGSIRRIAFTGRADDEQGTFAVFQALRVQIGERQQTCRPSTAQRCCGLSGKLLCKSRLACVGDQGLL